MTNAPVENSGSFSDPSQAARLRDLLNGLIEDRVKTLSPTRMTGMVLDIYQGGPTFNSDITVDSTVIPRTQDNPERPYVAKIRLDDKFEGGIVEARIDPNLIPIFRKADFFDEENPAGSGTMVDRAGRYITVEVTGDGSAPVDDTYPSLIGTTLQAPQAAPRVALVGSAASWRVSELIRGVLAIQTNPATLMLGPDYARFDTNTLTWGGTIAFARGSEIKAYEIYPDAPIVTYGSEPLEVSITEPVEIVLGQRSGSMYLNFSATDGVPVLVWVEAGSDTPIPPEWYLVFARINDGDLSSKLVFSSLTDFRSPSAPDNLVLTYAKTGYEKLGLTASWNEVVEGTNGDPISISGYELWGMLNEEDWRRITTTTDTHVAGLTFDSSSEWHFKVRAMGQNGIPGVFSEVEAVTFPEETEVIGGGNRTYWQATKPTEGNEGDQWFDTDDGNKHYIYDSTSDDYVAAPFGSGALDTYVNNLIATAVSDAAEANGNAELAITTANGKNNIFVQTTKPTLTGRTSGDIWLDSDDGNKIYTFDGADFVPGLIGAAALADGSVIASKLAANSITAGSAVIAEGAIGSAQIANLAVDKLTGGTLQADISLAAKIQAGSDSLGLVKLDSTGIRVIDGSGIQQTAFNTTGGSVFKGDLEAAGIEASGSVKMHGSASEVSVNGKLYLATGVTAPSIAPSLSYILDASIALVGAPGTFYTPEAVIRDDSNGEWLSKNVDTSTGVVYIYRHNADGTYKSTQATFTPSGNYVYYKPESAFGLSTQNILSGFAYIGGVVWVPRASWSTGTAALTYDIQFQIYSSGGTAKNIGSLCDECNKWNYDGFLTLGQVIGSSTLIAIAHKPVVDVSVSSSNSVTVSNLNPSTLAYTNSVVLPADFKVETTVTVPYLSFGNYDFGASRYLLCFTQSNFAKVARSFTTAGVEQTSENFQLEGISGVGYTGSVVWSANGSAVWSHIANISGDIKFAFSWYDSQGTTHETSISPISTRLDSVSSRRRKIRVTTTSFTPDLSGDGIDKVRIYGGLTEGTMFLQSEISTNQATYSTLASSGTSPNSGTAFPSSGTAAAILNSAGTVRVDGAGSVSAATIIGGAITANTSMKVGSADVLIPSTGISRTLQTMSSLVMNPNSSYCRASSGWWIQEATDAYVTTGNGYPVASMPGIMEVHVKADGTVAVQRYTTFEADPRVFIRYYASSAWSAWVPVTNNALPKFKASSTTNLSLAASYKRIINLTEEYDSHSAFTPSTGFFVAPVAGVYDFKAGLCFTTSSNRRFLQIEKGTAAAGSNTPLVRVEGPATGYSAINISVDVKLAAGDSVAFVAYSASATTSNGSFAPNFFSGRLVD